MECGDCAPRKVSGHVKEDLGCQPKVGESNIWYGNWEQFVEMESLGMDAA